MERIKNSNGLITLAILTVLVILGYSLFAIPDQRTGTGRLSDAIKDAGNDIKREVR